MELMGVTEKSLMEVRLLAAKVGISSCAYIFVDDDAKHASM